MRLHLSEFLRHLADRPMTMLNEQGIANVPPGHPGRRSILSTFRPMLHQAGKFIFDSGQDDDEETTTAVRETATAMMDDGRFHLPYPITWIEDPFEIDPAEELRHYYLAREEKGEIRVWMINRPDGNRFMLNLLPTMIDLNGDFSRHRIPCDIPPGHPGHNPTAFALIRDSADRLDYKVRKFVVTLGAGGVEREDISTGHLTGAPNAAQKSIGHYPYTVIRVPAQTLSDGSIPTSGKRRRRHFVRGFVWGKNTRPREEQRWVAGYYRGDADLGAVELSHYEMRA